MYIQNVYFIHIHFIAVIIFHRNKLLFDNSEKSIAPFVLPNKLASVRASKLRECV